MDTFTIPTSLHDAIAKVGGVLSKRNDELQKIQRRALDTIVVPAQTMAGEWDGFATSHAGVLTSKAGNIIDAKVAAALEKAGETLPFANQTEQSRILRIGRNVPAGEAKATLKTFADAEWQQPADAVAPGAEPVILSNTQDIKTFASWCEVRYRSSSEGQHKTFRIVDDVLIKHEDFERLTKAYVAPDEEVYDEQEDQEEQQPSPDASEEEQPSVKPAGSNVVNTGALSAVFAQCDDDTVSAAITVDMSQYDTVDELLAVALSALATATLLKRAEDRQPVEA